MIFFESLYMLENAFHMIVELKTAYVIKGEKVKNVGLLFARYRKHGFYNDLFAIMPLNIILTALE